MIYTVKRKLEKKNKFVAWLILLAIIFSLGAPVWSDEPDDDGDEEDPAINAPKMTYDLPLRDEDALWGVMRKVAETDSLELRVLEAYEYTGVINKYEELYVRDAQGERIAYTDGLFEANEDGTIIVRVYDEGGEFIEERPLGNFTRKNEGEGDNAVVRLTYNVEVSVPEEKVAQEGQFAVRNKSNGFIWWSAPINASHDPYGNEVMINNISSPITFYASNHETHAPAFVYSNTIQRTGSPPNYNFTNALDSIDDIDNGVRFNYSFPNRHTKMSMEVKLEGDSILVTIPEERLKEDDIRSAPGASVMLTMSLLKSFGAGAEGEAGYIVVPDGSGAIIEFDNNKVNSAQYFGQVYGRDRAVSQKYAPTVTQQVYLPVFGIVRDEGANALVAIAEKGDENAIVRATVSRQGSRASDGALANNTAYNLAWFDFQMRTVDSFRIGTENRLLSIYESEYIKTGDISVRYFPLAGEGLSYADVAHAYREYLIEYKGVTDKTSSGDTPFYMTLNGGTVKRHSILGFPVNLQTAATTYSQAEEMINILKAGGVSNFVITYDDFNTAGIKREVSTSVQYARILGSSKGFGSLNGHVSGTGGVLYPSIGFMEFAKSGNGYNILLHSSREVTRSRAMQQRYELAFGTPCPYQISTAILSPYYFTGAIDNIISSLKKEGITSVSLDQATWMLYSDFSRTNPWGNIYFNRRDTVQVLTEGFKRLNDAGISIMAQSANAYALPYVSHISNVPMSSSNYDILDYDVPFYQIVIQGLIPYSTTPFNANSNLSALTLLSLSTGTPVHYEFMYESAGVFNDSDYNKKFFASFHGWADEAAANYKMFDELVGDVINTKIIGHKRLGINEYETVFEGGKTVYVNLNTEELKINGNTVDWRNYLNGGGN
jgi:hypothetical protein